MRVLVKSELYYNRYHMIHSTVNAKSAHSSTVDTSKYIYTVYISTETENRMRQILKKITQREIHFAIHLWLLVLYPM